MAARMSRAVCAALILCGLGLLLSMLTSTDAAHPHGKMRADPFKRHEQHRFKRHHATALARARTHAKAKVNGATSKSTFGAEFEDTHIQLFVVDVSNPEAAVSFPWSECPTSGGKDQTFAKTAKTTGPYPYPLLQMTWDLSTYVSPRLRDLAHNPRPTSRELEELLQHIDKQTSTFEAITGPEEPDVAKQMPLIRAVQLLSETFFEDAGSMKPDQFKVTVKVPGSQPEKTVTKDVKDRDLFTAGGYDFIKCYDKWIEQYHAAIADDKRFAYPGSVNDVKMELKDRPDMQNKVICAAAKLGLKKDVYIWYSTQANMGLKMDAWGNPDTSKVVALYGPDAMGTDLFKTCHASVKKLFDTVEPFKSKQADIDHTARAFMVTYCIYYRVEAIAKSASNIVEIAGHYLKNLWGLMVKNPLEDILRHVKEPARKLFYEWSKAAEWRKPATGQDKDEHKKKVWAVAKTLTTGTDYNFCKSAPHSKQVGEDKCVEMLESDFPHIFVPGKYTKARFEGETDTEYGSKYKLTEGKTTKIERKQSLEDKEVGGFTPTDHPVALFMMDQDPMLVVEIRDARTAIPGKGYLFTKPKKDSDWQTTEKPPKVGKKALEENLEVSCKAVRDINGGK